MIQKTDPSILVSDPNIPRNDPSCVTAVTPRIRVGHIPTILGKERYKEKKRKGIKKRNVNKRKGIKKRK